MTNAVTKAWATLLGSQRELFISLARAERIPSCLSPSKICLRSFLPYILIILEVWPPGPSATRGSFLERQNMGPHCRPTQSEGLEVGLSTGCLHTSWGILPSQTKKDSSLRLNPHLSSRSPCLHHRASSWSHFSTSNSLSQLALDFSSVLLSSLIVEVVAFTAQSHEIHWFSTPSAHWNHIYKDKCLAPTPRNSDLICLGCCLGKGIF